MSLPDDVVPPSNQTNTQKQDQSNQPAEPVSQPAKESEPAISVSEKREFQISERLAVPEISEDIEKVEAVAGAEVVFPQLPVTDETGQVVLDDAAPRQVTVTLPMSEAEMTAILKMKLKVVEAGLWLAEQTKMLAKKMGGKFIYRYREN